MNDLNTIANNMLHAARNRETAEIGGGTFGPAELREAAKALRFHGELLAALQAIVEEAGPLMGHNPKTMGSINRIAYIARQAIEKASQ